MFSISADILPVISNFHSDIVLPLKLKNSNNFFFLAMAVGVVMSSPVSIPNQIAWHRGRWNSPGCHDGRFFQFLFDMSTSLFRGHFLLFLLVLSSLSSFCFRFFSLSLLSLNYIPFFFKSFHFSYITFNFYLVPFTGEFYFITFAYHFSFSSSRLFFFF